MVRPGGLELPTFWFVARRSIQLSYGRTVIHTNNTTRPIRLSSRWQLENHANSGPRMGGSQLTLQILFVLPPDINHRRRLRLTPQFVPLVGGLTGNGPQNYRVAEPKIRNSRYCQCFRPGETLLLRQMFLRKEAHPSKRERQRKLSLLLIFKPSIPFR
jgi:hypothetical protein